MTITTAARRMARTLNKRRAGWRLYFDQEGHEVCAIYGPTAFDPPSDTYEHAFVTYQERNVPGAPLHRWTYRDVQEALDRAAEMEELMKSQAWANTCAEIEREHQ